MAVDHEITITRGDTYEGRVRWKDSSGTVVTPTAARMQIRTTHDATSTQLSLSLGSGLAVDGDGYVVITITAAQSAALTSGVYDVELTNSSGTVKTVMAGALTIDKDVTR